VLYVTRRALAPCPKRVVKRPGARSSRSAPALPRAHGRRREEPRAHSRGGSKGRERGAPAPPRRNRPRRFRGASRIRRGRPAAGARNHGLVLARAPKAWERGAPAPPRRNRPRASGGASRAAAGDRPQAPRAAGSFSRGRAGARRSQGRARCPAGSKGRERGAPAPPRRNRPRRFRSRPSRPPRAPGRRREEPRARSRPGSKGRGRGAPAPPRRNRPRASGGAPRAQRGRTARARPLRLHYRGSIAGACSCIVSSTFSDPPCRSDPCAEKIPSSPVPSVRSSGAPAPAASRPSRCWPPPVLRLSPGRRP